MSLTPSEVWDRLLSRARTELPEQIISVWLQQADALAFDGRTLTLATPDQFTADWNESKYAELLAGLGPIALGHPVRVVFRVNDERKKRSQRDLFVETPVIKTVGGQYGGVSTPLS